MKQRLTNYNASKIAARLLWSRCFDAFAAILFGILLVLSTTAIAKVTILKEVLLTTNLQPAMQPRVAIKGENGSFIVAGSTTASKKGWATRVEGDGKVRWDYGIELLSDDQALFASQPITSPRFLGAVSMPDGSAFLCGAMPRPPGRYSPGLLVHVDGDGQVVREQLILPKLRNELGIAEFDDCLRLGDDIVLLGRITHFVKPGETPRVSPAPAYWLLVVDFAGNIKSEFQINASITNASTEVGPLLLGTGSTLVFSATDNLNTEILTVATGSTILARKTMPGRFLLVRPVERDGLIQIYGLVAGDVHAGSDPLPTVITLSPQLQEIARVAAAQRSVFAARRIYREPNKSFVLFGSVVHRVGETFTSAAAQFDASLQSETTFDFSEGKIDDGAPFEPRHTPKVWGSSLSRGQQSAVTPNQALFCKQQPNSCAVPALIG